MDEDAAMALFRDYVSVWQSGSLDALTRLIAPDYVGHPAGGDRDLDGLRARIIDFRAAFPDVVFHIEGQIARGDTVASRMIACATRAADGCQVVLHGLNMSRIEDGRIAEEWMAWEVTES